MQFVEAESLADLRLNPPFRHVAETALRRAGQVLSQVMDPRLLVHYFVIADVAVAFAGHVDHASVGIVKGEKDSRGGIDHFAPERSTQILLRPQGVLAIWLARESGREEPTRIAQVDHFAGFAADVTSALLDHSPRPRLHDAQLLVFASCGQ